VRHRVGPTRLGGGRLGRTLAAAVPAVVLGVGVRAALGALAGELPPLVVGVPVLAATGAAYLALAASLRLPEAMTLTTRRRG
jgi:hypothetical protein